MELFQKHPAVTLEVMDNDEQGLVLFSNLSNSMISGMVENPKKHGKVIPGVSSATQSAGTGTDPDVFQDAEGKKIWDSFDCLWLNSVEFLAGFVVGISEDGAGLEEPPPAGRLCIPEKSWHGFGNAPGPLSKGAEQAMSQILWDHGKRSCRDTRPGIGW